ncbi:hypothetical protein HK405_001465, partial [Cladochytrium tenue]
IGIGVVVGSCLGSSLVATAAAVASVALSSASAANTAGSVQNAYCLAGMTSSCCSALSSSDLSQAIMDIDNIPMGSKCALSWVESVNWSADDTNFQACVDSYNKNRNLASYTKCIATDFTILGSLASMCSLRASDINALNK